MTPGSILLKVPLLIFQAQEVEQIKAPRLMDKEGAAECQGPQLTEMPRGCVRVSRLK